MMDTKVTRGGLNKLSFANLFSFYDTLMSAPTNIVPLSLHVEEFWMKKFRARLQRLHKRKLLNPPRFGNAFHDLFGSFRPEDFGFAGIQLLWEANSDRLRILDRSVDIADTVWSDVLVSLDSDDELITTSNDFVDLWLSGISYELSLDVYELDYTMHGEVDPEIYSFAIPRPSDSFLSRDWDPDDQVFIPKKFEHTWETKPNRIVTTRRRKFRTKAYGRFKTVLRAGRRSLRKDQVEPDYYYECDFYDHPTQKDHFQRIDAYDLCYHNYWWYTGDIAEGIAFEWPMKSAIVDSEWVLEEELPYLGHRPPHLLCDIAYPDITIPGHPVMDEDVTYYDPVEHCFPLAFEYKVNPFYAIGYDDFDEDDDYNEYLMMRYDYYSRLEFIDESAVCLVDYLCDLYTVYRDDI